MKEQKWLLTGVGVATATGFLFRLIFEFPFAQSLLSVMSVGFLLCIPLLMGYLTILFAEKEEIYNITFSIFTPWLSIGALLILTLLLRVEGWGCWIMAMPIFMFVSSLGGILAHYWRKRQNNKNKLQVSLLFLLPFVVAPLEHWIGKSTQNYKAYTEIEINAPKEQIWGNVTRVKPINQQQDSAWFTRFIGLPRPIRAELDKEAVGGKRKAVFDKGLVFDEQVTAYQPYKLMVFTIHANPYDIPSTTMDKHIVVGGDFFDVLNGTYELIPLGKGLYKLRLYSIFKLHTTFNFYADIWAGWIMKDIQQNILKVIKQRSESTL